MFEYKINAVLLSLNLYVARVNFKVWLFDACLPRVLQCVNRELAQGRKIFKVEGIVR